MPTSVPSMYKIEHGIKYRQNNIENKREKNFVKAASDASIRYQVTGHYVIQIMKKHVCACECVHVHIQPSLCKSLVMEYVSKGRIKENQPGQKKIDYRITRKSLK